MSKIFDDIEALRKRIAENEKLLDELEKTALRQFEMGTFKIDGTELHLRGENIDLRRLIGKMQRG